MPSIFKSLDRSSFARQTGKKAVKRGINANSGRAAFAYLAFDSTAARSINIQYARSKECGIQIRLHHQNFEIRLEIVS